MATKARMRLYEGRAHLDMFLNSEKNIPQHILNKKAKVLEILMSGTTTIGEVEVDPLNAKMQLTTAELMEYVSSDALDKDILATGATRAFNAIIVDENNEPKNLECRMAALGTTLVHTDINILDCWHTNAIDWGGGDLDSEGNITLMKEDATVISTIAITANEGNGSSFKIPVGWSAVMLKGRLDASGDQAADEGVLFTMRVLDAIDAETDVRTLTDQVLYIYGTDRYDEFKPDNKAYQSGTEISFYNIWVDDGAEDWTARFYFLLWEK